MFFYTLPIFFNDIQSASPVECLFILSGLFVALFISAPQPNLDWKPQGVDSFLMTAWFGGVSLQLVFWPYLILLNVCLLFADYLAKTGKITVSSWDEIHFVILFTIVWWTTAIWRCSANTNTKLWAALARLTTIAVFIEYGLKLIIRIDYPRIFFNCEDILLDYGSCF
ncbi:MAG: hypothetical protein IPN42_04230 [Methylococcaceae bacterium]|nr:hypothetical protein [Methylococcaceae bacterium]